MPTQRRTVSRKTPLDGRLEIDAPDTDAARALGTEFALEVDGVLGRGRLATMRCTCAKGDANGAHEHHFVEGDPLRALAPGRDVLVDLRPAESRVVVSAP